MGLQAWPVLGIFKVFGRTGLQNVEGPQFWTLHLLYRLICQFERLWYLDYVQTDINAATRCVLRAKCDCGWVPHWWSQGPLPGFKGMLCGREGREEKEGMEGEGWEESAQGVREREVGTGSPIGYRFPWVLASFCHILFNKFKTAIKIFRKNSGLMTVVSYVGVMNRSYRSR